MRRTAVFIIFSGLFLAAASGCEVLQNIGKTTKQVDAHGAGTDYSTNIVDPDPTAPRRSPTVQDPP